MSWKKQLFDYTPWIIALVIGFLFIFQAQIDSLIYGNDPDYCGMYDDIRELWAKDTNKAFCVLNCGVERGCNNTNMIDPYYDNTSNMCYCANGLDIDYNVPRFGEYNFNENFTIQTK